MAPPEDKDYIQEDDTNVDGDDGDVGDDEDYDDD
jgi:hypothetical protein